MWWGRKDVVLKKKTKQHQQLKVKNSTFKARESSDALRVVDIAMLYSVSKSESY